MSDPFAELFRTLRVRSAVYFAQDFAAPWGMSLPRRPYIQFHVALAGAFRVDWVAGALDLSEHEVVLFPNGSPHSISDGSGSPLRDGRDVVQAIQRGETPFPGDAPQARILSGHFEFDREAQHPLLRHLPEMVHVAAPEGFEVPLYQALEQLISVEAASRRPGAQSIVERLAEIFLIQILRVHFGKQGSSLGLLGAMFDARLGAGVTEIHSRWAEPLTLEDIAKAAGMSRSAFAASFAATAGITPIAYLAQWRLLKGRQLLADRNLSVAQVAAACGHLSTEGFSRAFRRFYGQSPKTFREVK